MMGWAMMILLIAILAGIFIGGVYAAAASIAQALFVVFLALFVIGLVASGFRRSSTHGVR